MVKIVVNALFLLISGFVFSTLTYAEPLNYEQIAHAIQNKYETQWIMLSPRIQSHYAIRLYRLTGDEKYIPAIYLYQLSNTTELLQDWSNRNNKEYVKKRAKQLLDYFAKDTDQRTTDRLKTFANRPEMAFNLNLLAMLYQANDLKLLNTFPYNLIKSSEIIDYFKKIDFADYLLDEQVIQVYSAQVVNYVVYLKALGINNLERKYMDKFKKVFFAGKKEEELSIAELEAKAYGLTHIILASSLYYQQEVLGDQYQWIEDYFTENQEYLLKTLKTDVVMEIGLVFLLRGQSAQSPIVEAVKQHIANVFSTEAQLLPGKNGNVDLNSSEHRNVLAFMILSWPETLHTGPDLALNKNYQNFIIAPTFAL